MPFEISKEPLAWEGDGSEVVGSITLPVHLCYLPGRSRNRMHLTFGGVDISYDGVQVGSGRIGVSGGMEVSTNNGLTVWLNPYEMAELLFEMAKSVEAKAEIERRERDANAISEGRSRADLSAD